MLNNLDGNLDLISEQRLRDTITKLTSWPNRNTNSPYLSEAANWIADQMRVLPGMKVELFKYTIEPSARVPERKEVVQVVGILPGVTDRRVIIGGHFDTINMTNREDTTGGIAPGANDDGSGTAAVIECARAMSRQKWQNTLVFVAFSGEEQGLLGSRALAKAAKTEHWNIDAVLSNDMIGNSSNKLGQSDHKHVRIFSEESKDHNSRELGRFVAWLGRDGKTGVTPKLVFRADRFGRGGDHTPFNQEGFTAVRVVEVHEEYSRQHTPDDRPEFVDYGYLASNARLNLLTLSALANAGAAPTNVRVDRSQGYDTHLSWKGTPGTAYVVYWRETTSPVWESSREVGSVSEIVIPKVHKDDHVFAVGAVGGVPVEAK